LVTASPRNATTGAAVILRMAGGGRKAYHHGGQHYRAGVTQMLRLGARIEWGDEGWTGGVVPSTGTVAWAPSSSADLATFSAYFWRNAAITVDEVDEDSGVITNRLTGKVVDAVPQDGKLLITIADLAAGLGRPVVTARFAGTGGIEGGAEAAGLIKSRTWGRAFNIEGHVFDKANNIYAFGDNAFPWQSFDAVRDGGRDASPAPTVVAWQGSIAATLAALVASSPVQGSGVVAPSIVKAKWWTQARGPLTADVRGEIGTGYVETVPEIAARILAAVGGPSVTNASTAAGWRPGVAGIHIDEGEDINAALTRLTMGVSLFWILNAAAGTITFREFTFSSPVASLVSDDVSRERTVPPMKTRRVGYQRSYRLHSDGDIVTTLLQSDPAAATKLTGIEAGATKNLYSAAPTEPAAPPEGYLWIDTSGTYAVFKLRTGGAWVTGANALNAYNALTGKPIALADINSTESSKLSGIAHGATSGRNLVTNPGAESGSAFPWITDDVDIVGGPFTIAASTTAPKSGKYSFAMVKPASGHGFAMVSPAIPVTPGKKYLFRVSVSGNGSASAGTLYLRIAQRTSAPSSGYVTGSVKTSGTELLFGGSITAGYVDHVYTYTAPAGITFVSLFVASWVNAPATLLVDDFEIYELTDHELNADVSRVLSVPPAPQVQFDYSGTTSAQLPLTLSCVMVAGGVVVTAATSFVFTPSGCSVSASGMPAGSISLTGVAANNASISVTATYQGVSRIETIGPITRLLGSAPGGAGSGGAGATNFSASVNATISDTTYDGSPQPLFTAAQMQSNSGGHIRLVLNGDYQAPPGETSQVTAKAQKSTDNATWSDVGLSVTGSTSTGGYYDTPPGQPIEIEDYVEGSAGSISANTLATGFTASTNYYIRWIAYKSGSAASAGVTGSASGGQS
jgi:hypothetical protein